LCFPAEKTLYAVCAELRRTAPKVLGVTKGYGVNPGRRSHAAGVFPIGGGVEIEVEIGEENPTKIPRLQRKPRRIIKPTPPPGRSTEATRAVRPDRRHN
jgi:hypothetical protein